MDEIFKIMRQSFDTQGISINEKTPEELPTKHSDELDNISTSTFDRVLRLAKMSIILLNLIMQN